MDVNECSCRELGMVMNNAWRRIGNDLRRRRNIEVYAAALLAIVFAILSILGDIVPENLRWATLLAGVALLVYRLAVPDGPVAIDAFFRDRKCYDAVPLASRFENAHEVWIFGPSAVNILSPKFCDDLRRTVLAREPGVVRVAVLDPAAQHAIRLAEQQLDGSIDYPLQTLRPSLRDSVQRLKLMASWDVAGEISYRFVDYNPGFSMVAIDPGSHSGVVIVEIHGFHNETTDSRMHFEISGSDGSRWYSYWTDQFRHIWDSASTPPSTE